MSSPSKPMDITSPRRENAPDLPEVPVTITPVDRTDRPASGRSTPVRGFRQYGTPPTPPIANIPPRASFNYGSPSGLGIVGLQQHTSPSSRRGSTSQGLRPRTPVLSGSPGTGSPKYTVADEISEEEMARVLRRHLVSRNERQAANTGRNTPDPAVQSEREHAVEEEEVVERDRDDSKSSVHSLAGVNPSPPRQVTRQDSDAFPIPFEAPGGDITHPIYKWQKDQRRHSGARQRAASFTARPTNISLPPALEHIHEPGGFRRHYVLQRANDQGLDEPVLANNFIEFLYLFGHFAGEDLEEEEEDDEAYLEAALARAETVPQEPHGRGIDEEQHKPLEASEVSPLLARGGSTRSLSRIKRMRRSSIGPHGDATVTQAVLMLLKSFVGTGVLFLGKAFFNGGILFSTITLVGIAIVSLYSFLLLVRAKQVVPGSFGDIGGHLYGPWMRYSILTSIAISQIGFVCAYTIFVSENLQAFVLAVTKCVKFIPVQYFILMQLVIFMPLALIRNIAKLSTTALVADAFILAGLLYLFGSEISLIAHRGVADVALFNPKDFPLLIGTAVFSFEGIGLVIPITDAMREPHKFPRVLTGVMIFLMFLFGGAGALAYAAFGSEIQTVVIVNLDSTSKFVQAVQLLYSLAILLSVPLQLFPAVRIMENGIFTRSGKEDTKVKWEKNFFRFLIVMFCAGISWAGAKDLDKFVALVGSFACVPLCYVYPPMLHYRACARTRKAKIADIALMIFGSIAAIYTTAQTVALMMAPGGGSPKFGNCDTPPSL